MNNRVVPRDQARLLGVILMIPLVIGLFSAGSLITPTGELDFNALQQSALLELGSLVIALGLAAYIVYSIPSSGSTTSAAQPARRPLASNPFAPPPVAATKPLGAIVTVPEAAAYLGITEAEVLRLIETSQLGAARSGSSYRIARIALDDFKQRKDS